MDSRAAKLALARKKLKDHQEKKQVPKLDEPNVHIEVFPVNLNNKDIFPEQENVCIPNEKSESTLSKPTNHSAHPESNNVDIHVTEYFISNERNLELQVAELKSKFNQLDSIHKLEINKHNELKQEIKHLQNELQITKDKCLFSMQEIKLQENKINEYDSYRTILMDENNNLSEQLELTRTILTSKETENISLNSQLKHLQNELDVTKLQLQQLINGSNINLTANETTFKQNEELSQKISSLEQQLRASQKDKDQINLHYEQYAGYLNEQLRTAMTKNEDLTKEIKNLSERETSLISQIGDMEIHLQYLQVKKPETLDHEVVKIDDINDIQNKYMEVQEQLQDTNLKYVHLQSLLTEKELKVKELQDIIDSQPTQENISISKLTADITSDKIAAQRATEQNKKLKTSVQELEEAFVKMSQDKLELTEKLTAEKYLNRELTIKLADFEEKCKEMIIKVRAKDEEMIRLQTNYRELAKEYKNVLEVEKNEAEIRSIEYTSEHQIEENNIECRNESSTDIPHTCNHDIELMPKDLSEFKRNTNIAKEDAMVKLQERFLKIMSEVADLSDEKHRLEHIILQLQNETDTICEYVALYQQQRNLLKKRDEERASQVKMFQIECDRLKSQLEELSGILLKFAEDKELSTYFQVESRQKDMNKVSKLLLNLKSNSLVDPKKSSLELANIYPCNCCSGNLIDV